MEPRTGLKDHQIAQLINAVRDELRKHPSFVVYGPLRAVIATAVTDYLLAHNLMLDHPGKPSMRDGRFTREQPK